MIIYARKLFDHDITHEISITKPMVEAFIQGTPGNHTMRFIGKRSQLEGIVSLNTPDDPRFGGDIKRLLAAEGNGSYDVGDIIVLYKYKTNKYVLELLKSGDSRYNVVNDMFYNNDRHLLMFSDENEDNDDYSENKSKDEKAENILLYGVPGSGKSHYIKTHYQADDEHMERVVFHPEYSFSDFVGQILPVEENNSIKYKFTPGPFTNILRRAIVSKEVGDTKPFYLIIEEINRGNAPAIFGDLFQLLDRSEDGESEYGITNYDIANEVYKDISRKVRIPSNLWIIATMNTSDQNVFTLDTAFQRRWNMKLIKNDIASADHADKNIERSEILWGDFAEEINKTILEANESVGSFGDKRLGAYFAKKDELDVDHFSGKVLKYLWDDAFKMNHDMVFVDSINSLELLIETYKNAVGDPLKVVLRQDLYEKMKKQQTEDIYSMDESAASEQTDNNEN